MADGDQQRWDKRYAAAKSSDSKPALPAKFEDFVDQFSTVDTALEVASGNGETGVWLALQGVHVTAYDISPVAVKAASELADHHGVADRCNFIAADLDDGLPPGPAVDLVLCHMFRDPRLDQALVDRLNPGGLLAVAALSEVGAEPGRFRAKPNELVDAFAALEMLGAGEGDGVAWLVVRKS